MSVTTPRTKHPETFLSLTILGILIAISLMILSVQNRFNPAVDNLTSKIDDAATLPEDSGVNDIVISAPDGIQPMLAGERFDPETLSDKINGKAELYLSAGFVELITQRFQTVNDAGTWFEVFIYDMGTPSNAFAVFSTQRRKETDKLALTRNAYGTANAVFFTTDHYYVEMIAATAGPEAVSQLTIFAEHYLAQSGGNVEVQGDATDPQQLFPTQGLTPDSFTLIAKDAFGFDRFDQVYTARYGGTETEMTLFVSRRPFPAEADTLAAAYRDFLMQFGGSEATVPSGSIREGIFIIDILDAYEIVFSKDPYLAGVHMAEDKDAALQLALQLDRHLDSISDRRPKKE